MNNYPLRGLGMILITIFFSIALLIYVGAGFSEYRIEERKNGELVNNLWWEKGFISVCPLH
ncbi:MAG: hypothetical protein H2015_01140 [Chloroflexi bacterium]|nr:hypothetical protein [Chloroflexota bacterium]|tara:strand:+ start:177 stop:359 length:183 start_codon:yes stop_codon:yes gene_type:complete